MRVFVVSLPGSDFWRLFDALWRGLPAHGYSDYHCTPLSGKDPRREAATPLRGSRRGAGVAERG